MPESCGTSGGVEITDAVIERLAHEAERGFDHARLRPRGRPPIGAAAAKVTQVRLPPDLAEALARRALRDHSHKSEVIRRALKAYLQGRRRASARDVYGASRDVIGPKPRRHAEDRESGVKRTAVNVRRKMRLEPSRSIDPGGRPPGTRAQPNQTKPYSRVAHPQAQLRRAKRRRR